MVSDKDRLLRDLDTVFEAISADIKDVANGLANSSDIAKHLDWLLEQGKEIQARLVEIKSLQNK